MKYLLAHKFLLVTLAVVIALVLFVLVQFFIIKYSGAPVAVPTIPRSVQEFGEGPELRFAVLGDSTAVGQGGDYTQGIATNSALFLSTSQGSKVLMQNFAVSGARTSDVLRKQLKDALAFNPDVILLAIGANDVTHLTSVSSMKHDMNSILQSLKKQNPDMKIIMTGSPQVGSVPRFVWPVDYLASNRVKQVNKMFIKLSKKYDASFAPIAHDTGDYFAAHPELFAADNFHPNNAGYAVWNPTLQAAFSSSFKSQ